MNMNDLTATFAAPASQSSHTRPPADPLYDHSSLEERLPFTIRLVRNKEDLRKAVLIRHSAYGRHVPQFAETLRLPEPADSEDGVVVLLAESKLNGAPVGTMRIQTNRFKPLSVEQSLCLPDWLQGRSTAEATRLGVTGERIGRLVKTALFKAYYQYCVHAGIDWMVITARSPLDRQYERLMFKDIYPGMGYVPIRHVGNMPHRVMSFSVSDARRNWREANHPLFDYVFRTNHSDINVNPVQIPVRMRMQSVKSVDEMTV